MKLMSNVIDYAKQIGRSKGAKMLKVFLKNRVLVTVLVAALVLAALPISAFVASAADVEPIVVSADGTSITFNVEGVEGGFKWTQLFYKVYDTEEEARADTNVMSFSGSLTDDDNDGVYSITVEASLANGNTIRYYTNCYSDSTGAINPGEQYYVYTTEGDDGESDDNGGSTDDSIDPIAVSADGKSVTFKLEDNGYDGMLVYFNVFNDQASADAAVLNSLHGDYMTNVDGVWTYNATTSLTDGQIIKYSFNNDANNFAYYTYTASSGEGDGEGDDTPPADTNILKDTAFSSVGEGGTTWISHVGSWAGSSGTITGNGDGSATINATAIGGEWGIQLYQNNIAISADKDYILTFSVDSTFNFDKIVGTKLQRTASDADGGNTVFNTTVTVPANSSDTFTVKFNGADYTEGKFMFWAGGIGEDASASGTLKIYDVSIVEDPGEDDGEGDDTPPADTGILKDTAFSSVGIDGTTWYAYSNSAANTLAGDSSGKLTITIGSLVDADWWDIQAIQEGIKVEAGKYYKLTYSVKSTMDIDKQIRAKLQNANQDTVFILDDVKTVPAGETKTFVIPDIRGEAYDNGKFLFAAGQFDGEAAGSSGTLEIYDVSLVETEAPEVEVGELVNNGLINDVQFTSVTPENGGGIWTYHIGSNWDAYSFAEVKTSPSALTFDIDRVGGGWADAIWGLQLFQGGISLAADQKYILSFDINSTLTENKKVKVKFASGVTDEDVVVPSNGTYHYHKAFSVKDAIANDQLVIAFAAFDGENPEDKGTVSFSNFKLIPVYWSVVEDVKFTDVGTEADNVNNVWETFRGQDVEWSSNRADVYGDTAGNLIIDYEAVGGDSEWTLQIYQKGVNLEGGKTYRIMFDAASAMNANKSMRIKLEGGETLLDDVFTVPQGGIYCFDKTITIPEGGIADARLLMSGGVFWDTDNAEASGTIKISDFVFYDVSGASGSAVEVEIVPAAISADGVKLDFMRAVSEDYPGTAVKYAVFNDIASAKAATAEDLTENTMLLSDKEDYWYYSTDLNPALTSGQIIKYMFVDYDKDGKAVNSDFGYLSLEMFDYTGRTIEQMESDGWTLVWNDEFDGTALDTSKWFVQEGTGSQYGIEGWGNNEEQFYRSENATVADGQLTITGKAESHEGKNYTSARLRTATDDATLFSTTYGRVEALISLPGVSGAWPAFWMLPDTDIYGGWPVSGELDIMEARGNKPNTVCGTLHTGTPAQLFKGKDYYFPGYTDMNQYHLYAVEWEPGEIRWYVDDELYNTASYWVTRGSGNADTYTFGAPYDAPFHIILNLALGGNFGPGPIDTAALANGIEMKVDYVRVYHESDGYDDSDVQMKLPETGNDVEDGNLVLEDNFASLKTVSAVDPEVNGWQFYTGAEFGASATVDTVEKDGTTYAHVNVASVGNQNYAVQLIEHMPLIAGSYYRVTFDAYSSTKRSIIVHPSGDADNGWQGYASETVEITTTPTTYTFDFLMASDIDPSARLEFNLGGAAGTGDTYIGNVKVEMIEVSEEEKASVLKNALPDGNHIWNGTFDQGEDRLGYWLTENAAAVVPVRTMDALSTSDAMFDETYLDENGDVKTGDRNYTRRAQVTASADGARFYQTGINLQQSDSYKLGFDLYSVKDTTIEIAVTNKDGSVVYATDTVSYKAADGVKAVSSVFAMPAGVNDKEAVVAFVLPNGAAIQIDDVSLIALTENNKEPIEDLELEPVPEDSSDWYINYDTINQFAAVPDADGVYAIETRTGNVNYNSMFLHQIDRLAEGVTYTLKFEAKSDVPNTGYEVNVQQDNGTWPTAMDSNYKFDTTTEWQTYEVEFESKLEVTPDDVNPTYLKFLLGSCAEKTWLYMRNISLTAEPQEPTKDAPVATAEDVELGNDVVIKINDADWAEAFDESGVIMINGKNVKYTYDAAAGTVTIPGDVFAKAGDYTIQLTTEGYNNAVVEVSVYEFAERTVTSGDVTATAVMRSDVVLVVEAVSEEDGKFLDTARNGRVKIGYYEVHFERDDVEIPYADACKGTMDVSFAVDKKYASDAILVHHRTGETTYDEYKTAAVNGVVTVEVDSLSPFSVITTEKPSTGSSSGVKTGDNGMTTAIVVNIVLLSALTAAYLKREEIEELIAKIKAAA